MGRCWRYHGITTVLRGILHHIYKLRSPGSRRKVMNVVFMCNRVWGLRRFIVPVIMCDVCLSTPSHPILFRFNVWLPLLVRKLISLQCRGNGYTKLFRSRLYLYVAPGWLGVEVGVVVQGCRVLVATFRGALESRPTLWTWNVAFMVFCSTWPCLCDACGRS